MIIQLPWDPATEHFTDQAILHRPVGFFVLERHIQFVDGIDGLDYYRAALLQKDGRTRFLLRQYRGSNSSHTSVCLDPGKNLLRLTPQFLNEITELVEGIVEDLGLTNKDIVWQRKDTPGA